MSVGCTTYIQFSIALVFVHHHPNDSYSARIKFADIFNTFFFHTYKLKLCFLSYCIGENTTSVIKLYLIKSFSHKTDIWCFVFLAVFHPGLSKKFSEKIYGYSSFHDNACSGAFLCIFFSPISWALTLRGNHLT